MINSKIFWHLKMILKADPVTKLHVLLINRYKLFLNVRYSWNTFASKIRLNQILSSDSGSNWFGALAISTIFLWSLIKLRKRILNYTTLTNLWLYVQYIFFLFMLLTMLFKFAQKHHFPLIILIGHFFR